MIKSSRNHFGGGSNRWSLYDVNDGLLTCFEVKLSPLIVTSKNSLNRLIRVSKERFFSSFSFCAAFPSVVDER